MIAQDDCSTQLPAVQGMANSSQPPAAVAAQPKFTPPTLLTRIECRLPGRRGQAMTAMEEWFDCPLMAGSGPPICAPQHALNDRIVVEADLEIAFLRHRQ